MVFTHSGATGRRTLLVDANPGIITLPTAHSMEFEEDLREQQEPLIQPEEDAGRSLSRSCRKSRRPAEPATPYLAARPVQCGSSRP